MPGEILRDEVRMGNQLPCERKGPKLDPDIKPVEEVCRFSPTGQITAMRAGDHVDVFGPNATKSDLDALDSLADTLDFAKKSKGLQLAWKPLERKQIQLDSQRFTKRCIGYHSVDHDAPTQLLQALAEQDRAALQPSSKSKSVVKNMEHPVIICGRGLLGAHRPMTNKRAIAARGKIARESATSYLARKNFELASHVAR